MNKRDRKSDSSADLYEQEFLLLEELEITEKYKQLGKEELLAQFIDLAKKYKKLLKQSVKITRVGDSNQRKLLLANEKSERQNKELEASRKALSDELSHAADYITSLIPPPLTRGPVLTDWRFVPSAQLGGDALGYHWIDEEHFALYLLDVCSHGVRPALLSVSVLNVLRAQNLADTDFREPGDVLTSLNQVFQMKNHHNLFFSIWYGVYAVKTRELAFASAGHPPAILFSGIVTKERKPIELRTPNLVIGGRPDTSYRSRSVSVVEGAILYIFSDGAYEITFPGGNFWDLGKMQDFLRRMLLKNSPELDRLLAFIERKQGSNVLEDDLSILKVQFK
ncbi:MAG: PP2C family protein-serine/threonine phosphatase [bacterium]|nr:PP2C family protein-serine/threonine phosphatase [bacterium]